MSEADHKEKRLAELASHTSALAQKLREPVTEGSLVTDKAMTVRREFFEKLVVRDGGTIAFSVSLLGNLGAHRSPHLVRLLGTSWVFLVVGIALGMSRHFRTTIFAWDDGSTRQLNG